MKIVEITVSIFCQSFDTFIVNKFETQIYYIKNYYMKTCQLRSLWIIRILDHNMCLLENDQTGNFFQILTESNIDSFC